jgi:hypothetical protein
VALLDTAAKNGTTATVIANQLIAAIRADITANPGLLPLLDELLDVAKSAWPEIKLLTALANGSGATTAASTPAPAPQKPVKPVAAPKSVATPKSAPKPAEPTTPAPPKAPKPAARAPKGPEAPFEWVKFIEQLRTDGASGPAAILSSCGYAFDSETLTIYAGKKFNKARLDKAMPVLLTALANMEIEAIITVMDTPKPPADATTAAILDMMGGGEEVHA